MITQPISRRTPLGGTPATAGAARRYVRDVLDANHVNEKVIGLVELLTSEVVTNALLHARGADELQVEVRPAVVRVEVQDPSSLLPSPRRAGAEAVSGRGLKIVAALAQAWGVEMRPRGKRVWFEVERGEDSLLGRTGSPSSWDDRNSQS